MTNTSAYVSFLIVGVLLVAIDGQLIFRAGRPYLADMYRSEQAAAAANRLTTALFHLVVLGLLALLSAMPLGAPGMVQIVERIGILLLLLAAAHGATMGIFSWLRGRQRELTLTDGIAERRAHNQASHGVAPDAPTRQPYIAPDLDQP